VVVCGRDCTGPDPRDKVAGDSINRQQPGRSRTERVKSEWEIANAHRVLVLRWRSQTRTSTIAIWPRVEGTKIIVWFDVGDSFPCNIPPFNPFRGPCGSDGGIRTIMWTKIDREEPLAWD
jgi:hypothetical protein